MEKSKSYTKIQNVFNPAIVKKFCFVILISIFCIFNFTGCATYKFHHGKQPYDLGYVVSRDDYMILEYTIGPENSVPADRKLAKERFLRRKNIVEDYYKRMGYIENRFKATFWNYWTWIAKLVGGVFKLPFVAISDYRYEHDPVYREKIRKIDQEKEAREEGRIKSLKEKLNVYIQKDLTKEPSKVREPKAKQPTKFKEKVLKVKPKKEKITRQKTIASMLTKTEEQLQKISKPTKQKREKVKPIRKDSFLVEEEPQAVIIAKPVKGYSPLRVHFYGYKSHSPLGRIVSYEWDFGDQDTSRKKNPVNTYFSTTYGSVYFNATLTVKDEKGNTVSSSKVIEVMAK